MNLNERMYNNLKAKYEMIEMFKNLGNLWFPPKFETYTTRDCVAEVQKEFDWYKTRDPKRAKVNMDYIEKWKNDAVNTYTTTRHYNEWDKPYDCFDILVKGKRAEYI